MCTRKVGTVKVSFEISALDLGAVLRLASGEGVASGALYRRAVAEYLINHAPAEWWAESWPIGDGLTSESHGSAPTATG